MRMLKGTDKKFNILNVRDSEYSRQQMSTVHLEVILTGCMYLG